MVKLKKTYDVIVVGFWSCCRDRCAVDIPASSPSVEFSVSSNGAPPDMMTSCVTSPTCNPKSIRAVAPTCNFHTLS